MSMAVKLSSKKGSGWLVMRDDQPNVFVPEKDGVTQHNICIDYGTVVKWSVFVSVKQWEIMLKECGIPNRFGVV